MINMSDRYKDYKRIAAEFRRRVNVDLKNGKKFDLTARDFKKEYGNIQNHSIFWGLKYGLYTYDIFLEKSGYREINGEKVYYYRIRELEKQDTLPKSLKIIFDEDRTINSYRAAESMGPHKDK